MLFTVTFTDKVLFNHVLHVLISDIVLHLIGSSDEIDMKSSWAHETIIDGECIVLYKHLKQNWMARFGCTSDVPLRCFKQLLTRRRKLINDVQQLRRRWSKSIGRRRHPQDTSAGSTRLPLLQSNICFFYHHLLRLHRLRPSNVTVVYVYQTWALASHSFQRNCHRILSTEEAIHPRNHSRWRP